MKKLAFVFAMIAVMAVAATAAAQIPMPALPKDLRDLIDDKPIDVDAKAFVKFQWDDGTVKCVDELDDIKEVMQKHSEHVKAAYVYDQNTGKELLASKSFALVDSKIKPSKGSQGKYIVFYEKREDADAARKQFGGKVEPVADRINRLTVEICKTECEKKCNAPAPESAPFNPAPTTPAK
jgi:hypothetical protein